MRSLKIWLTGLVLLFGGCLYPAYGQNSFMAPDIYPVFTNVNGITPVALGFVCTTASGTSNPEFSYQDLLRVTPNADPILLNSAGRPASSGSLVSIYLIPGTNYRITLYAAGTGHTCNGVTVGTQIWQRDGIVGSSEVWSQSGLLITTSVASSRVVIDGHVNIGADTADHGPFLDVGASADVIAAPGLALSGVLRVDGRASTASSSQSKAVAEFYGNQTGPTTGDIQGVQGIAVTSNSSGTVTLAIGSLGGASNNGAGIATTLTGSEGTTTIYGAGGGTTAAAFNAVMAGQIGGAAGVYTNGYGLLIGTFGTGYTNKYGVYVTDTAAVNFFGGGIRIPAIAVSALPACAAGLEGSLRPVTDANSATFNAAVATGGSNHINAFCNGTGWVVH